MDLFKIWSDGDNFVTLNLLIWVVVYLAWQNVQLQVVTKVQLSNNKLGMWFVTVSELEINMTLVVFLIFLCLSDWHCCLCMLLIKWNNSIVYMFKLCYLFISCCTCAILQCSCYEFHFTVIYVIYVCLDLFLIGPMY